MVLSVCIRRYPEWSSAAHMDITVRYVKQPFVFINNVIKTKASKTITFVLSVYFSFFFFVVVVVSHY